jgi:poly(A) polymerase
VGGCVRDCLLGITPKDWDVCTNATPQEVLRVFRRWPVIKTGLKHGTVTVMVNHEPVEVTTFRVDGEYTDNRHPDEVTFVSRVEEDLARRDFTINAMAYNPERGLVDAFGGQEDLAAGRIRCVGEPDARFNEDGLRIMRALRFAARFDFAIENETAFSIRRNRHLLENVSVERIYKELKGMLVGKGALSMLLAFPDVMAIIMPEVAASFGFEQHNPHHCYDVWTHTAHAVQAAPADETLRLVMLLHDIGKPRTKRWEPKVGWTFHNHNYIGEKMIPDIFRKMKLPMNEKMKYVQKLVGLHMRPIVIADEEVTDSAVRRLLFEAGDDIDDLMLLCEADITSKNEVKKQRFLDNFKLVRQKLKDLEEKDRIRNFQPPVDGAEIMEVFGLAPCREVGSLKSAIKDAILDGIIPNEHDAAFEFMLERANKMCLTLKRAGCD